MTEKNKRATPIGPRWRWPGNWWLICWLWIAGRLISWYSIRKPAQPPEAVQQNKKFFSARSCQVLPLNGLGPRTQTLDAPVDLFRDWQANTNSILLGRQTSCTSQWMSGS